MDLKDVEEELSVFSLSGGFSAECAVAGCSSSLEEEGIVVIGSIWTVCGELGGDG